MICQTIPLHPYESATLTAICLSNTTELQMKPRRAVIVCPGGAYHGLANHEAEPVAWQFLAAGFATFVLRYGVKENAANCAPLCQVALAIKYLREHAEEFNLDPDHIFTCGFSAGGHLAGSAGVLWEGAHGWSLCQPLTGVDFPHNACWIDLAIKWAKEL